MSTFSLKHPRRWFAATGVALVLATGAVFGYRVFAAIRHIDPNASLGSIVGLAQNQDNVPGTIAYKLHHGERVNILLLGYGGEGHDGAYLTDSIMVVSVQGPDRVALTSIPRDTYVHLGQAFAGNVTYDNKINTAYEIPLINGGLGKPKPEYDQGFAGAGRLASKIVGDYMGQPIDYWAGVDFTAFAKVVDAVGGVNVVNPYALDDDAYPKGESGATMHIHFDKGPLHLDGEHALIYVRTRHADNDFGRSRRQQQVLTAVKEKALSVGAIPKLFDLLDALQNNVHTNMPIGDLKTFAGIANKINTAGAHHVSIDNTNFQYDTFSDYGAYILLQRDHSGATLRRFIAHELPPPAMLAEKAAVQFSSSYAEASQGYSLAGITSATMKMLDMRVVAPDTVPKAPPTTEIHDYSNGRATKTVEWLREYFNGTVVTESGSPTSTPGSSTEPSASGDTVATPDVVVLLGADYATQFNSTPPAATGSNVTPSFRPRPTPTPSQTTAAPSPSPTETRPSPSPSRVPCLPPLCKPSAAPSPPAASSPTPGQSSSPGGGPSPHP